MLYIWVFRLAVTALVAILVAHIGVAAYHHLINNLDDRLSTLFSPGGATAT